MNIAESYLSALGSGIQQGQQMQQARNESALAPLRQQALEQQIQSSQLGMDSTRQSMAFDAETHQIQVKEHLAKMTADERAAAAENLRQNIGLVISADTPEKWDNIASQAAPELVGQFGQREAIVNSLRTTEQQIAAYDAANTPVKPDWVTVDGHMVDRNAPGGPAVVPVAGMEPQGPEWQPAPPEMLAQYGAQAGQFNVKTGQFRDFNQPSSTSLTTNPDGTMTYAQGPGVTGAAPDATSPDKGYQRVYDASTNSYRDQAIPGSKAASEQNQQTVKMNLAATKYQSKFNTVDQTLTKAISLVNEQGRWAAGAGSALKILPESSARELENLLTTIKANLGFEELQAMRESSPTGGALGAVSDRETQYLQGVQATLDQATSPDTLIQIMSDLQVKRREFASERNRILQGGGAAMEDAAPAPGNTKRYNLETGLFE